MHALLTDIHGYLERHYKIDAYSATDEQLLEAGYGSSKNGRFLPQTSRAKSTVSGRWKNALWKKAQFFAGCDPGDLYTLLVELKTAKLHSEETAKLAAGIAQRLPGHWFYWVEAGKKNGVHMHVVMHVTEPPKKRVQVDCRYFKLNPWKLRYDQYDTPLEAIVRTVTYGAKIKQGGYRGDGKSWERTWLAEVREALECERVKVTLSDSNIPTKGMTTIPPDIEAMWLRIKSDRQRRRMEKLGYPSSV
ncbi:hypothetical protein [Deinococcus yunweiensis]|uniref:hypothetical protein n=1 Tax=Deinococcus yunweiensis TaxID=367282 RepID=UPI00398E94DC